MFLPTRTSPRNILSPGSLSTCPTQRDSPVSDTPAQGRCFSLPHGEGTFAKWDRLALDNNVAVRGACFCRPCVFGVVRWKDVERTRARCDVNCAKWCVACRAPKRVVKSDWLDNHATTSHNVLTQCRLRHVIIDRYCTGKKTCLSPAPKRTSTITFWSLSSLSESDFSHDPTTHCCLSQTRPSNCKQPP